MTGLPKSLSEWWSKKGTQERAKRKVLNLTRAPRKVEGQATFPRRIDACFSEHKSLKRSTGYVSPEILVCLVCGYTELVIPELKLRQLRKGMKAYRSKGAGGAA